MKTSDKFIIQVTWDEVPHLTEEMKKGLWDALPQHERDARSKGLPQLGSGRIYTVPEEEIVISPIELARHWPRFYGMDFGTASPTAVVWFAWDRESDIIYLYREYYQAGKLIHEHAREIKLPNPWIFGVCDPSGMKQVGDHKSGKKVMEMYVEEGLKLEIADNAVEAGIEQVLLRLKTGRLKVFNHCNNWRQEYRVYRRDKEGKVALKQKDHALDATRYAVVSGFPVALTEIEASNENEYEQVSSYSGGNPVTGY